MMGKFTIEKWKCDRCHIVMDKRPYGGQRAHYEIRVSVDYETAGGPDVTWIEMCAACDRDVSREISAMKTSADAARKEIARTT